jgi:hypothetical protein
VPVLNNAAVDVGACGVDAKVAGEGFGFAGGVVGCKAECRQAKGGERGGDGGFHGIGSKAGSG